ncbi:hypothetical protein [Kluyvera intermedia]|uniref:hypothetical protein n=1 Tax=Kluyvera intermedia TaxID=61648 RepID=UPI003523F902
MNQKSEIIPLLRQEEGVHYSPYIDSLGYPTTGIGFKLGPQCAPLNHCNQPRNDILTSMAYRMGVNGLGNFHHMLSAITV